MYTLGIIVAWSTGVFDEEIVVVILAVRDCISAIGITAGVASKVKKQLFRGLQARAVIYVSMLIVCNM